MAHPPSPPPPPSISLHPAGNRLFFHLYPLAPRRNWGRPPPRPPPPRKAKQPRQKRHDLLLPPPPSHVQRRLDLRSSFHVNDLSFCDPLQLRLIFPVIQRRQFHALERAQFREQFPPAAGVAQQQPIRYVHPVPLHFTLRRELHARRM